MATTTAPPRQEQPPSSTPANPANVHIGTLEEMLNLTFKHSGLYIKELQADGGTGRMKQQLQRVIPHATERFHDALDELENEVRLAQTVLRRDMALLKQDRKKREAAAKQHEVEKARLAAESKPVQAVTVVAEPVTVEKSPTPAPPEPVVKQEAPEPAKAKEPEPEPPVQREAEDTKAPPPIETHLEPPKDPLFDATPTTGNHQDSEFDFDAMFGDHMDETGDDNPHNDMMDTTDDMHFNLDGGNDEPSLLRGLEDFAKGSTDDNANQSSNMDMDFTMPDLPGFDITTDSKTNTNTDTNANTATKPAPPQPEPEPEPEPALKPDEPKPVAQPPPEANKEETSTNDDMLGTMATDNLEDLFNMDEYENPEQSSFDDAFFNFDQ
ncbi:tubulin-tyrsoine ligase [Pyrenophora seminiperda CCB06]|uniref:Tubulin-tyrsoine ligase n=1 Tax=Pyrenophora seminiperda CCB06 TaxID=1302712 RepID=A0A3M7M8M7_9PLEO|nr:tubulin-tyrsoine ligase [Pyrenophora seminiperda CCB06]